MGWLNILGVTVDDNKKQRLHGEMAGVRLIGFLRGLLNGPEQRLRFAKGYVRRSQELRGSYYRTICTDESQRNASIRALQTLQSDVLPSSLFLPRALRRSIKVRRRARWRRPSALHIFMPSNRAQHRYPGVFQAQQITLEELALPTTTSPIKLRRITRSWRPFL
jgi:hypothetical protein